ncbi:MAG: class I SAM-dependent methyltransferase [Deltaproteobacteria bacterium]|nr:class I SAM-dependent methyltransferase [Deltaproteobacteria bacterium]MDZ4345854.1 class I SAM-dependent methyltransferase [Candidatus Binatia bacterium]
MTYDELPYEDLAFYHTHPSNLAVVGTLCGLDPPAVETCRVLELGCGTGYNLLAMAQSLPAARFVGIDLSPRQIEYGRSLAAATGIDRVELHAQSISDLDGSLGQFDYIIAHGVFSWVPAEVRNAILTTCRRHLAPNGIAYVSYNTYPGWHIRTILRDALLFHAPANAQPLERIRRARAGLERMLTVLPGAESNYSRFLRHEMESLRTDSDTYLFHEHLETHNHPLRFEEFARMVSGHGLRFLAEARFGTNSFAQPEDMQTLLSEFSDDPMRREQYLDHLHNRSFRQSLLCHADVDPSGSPTLPALGALRVRCRVESLGVTTDAEGTEEERFRVNEESELTSTDPVLRAILHGLHGAWPGMVAVEELAAAVFDEVEIDRFAPGLPKTLVIGSRIIRGYANGIWLLFAYSPPFATEADQRPVAAPLARHKAATTGDVTNLLHRPVASSDVERSFLCRLDGTISHDRLASEAEQICLRRLAEAALLAQ